MSFILPLEKISKNDIKIAGGKGAFLGELSKIVPIPEGFVLPVSVFKAFVDFNDLEEIINKNTKFIFSKLREKTDNRKIEKISADLTKLILSGKVSDEISKEIFLYFHKYKMKYVAVRSSAKMEDGATNSWAGELESYLNTTEKNLIENIKKCWASLFSPRAISYSIEKNLPFESSPVAVVVQKMIQSEISGIVFTVHPVTKNKNQILIESCFGLGELIVGGEITPDSYIVDKRKNLILEIKVNLQEKMMIKKGNKNVMVKISGRKKHQQKLTGRQIIELAELSQKIENHFKKPQDIEWALKNNKFYIIQSRPITTL